jgi:hypothetical protein
MSKKNDKKNKCIISKANKPTRGHKKKTKASVIIVARKDIG